MTYELQLEFVPTEKRNNCTYGEQFRIFCPFCNRKNIIWSCEFKAGKTDGTNKCAHFSDFKNEKAVFRDDFDIVVDDRYVYVNDILFGYHGLGGLVYSLEDFLNGDENNYSLEENLTRLYATSYSSNHSGGPNDRAFFLLNYLKENKYKKQYTVNYQI